MALIKRFCGQKIVKLGIVSFWLRGCPGPKILDVYVAPKNVDKTQAKRRTKIYDVQDN
jgi:hypothetical protein